MRVDATDSPTSQTTTPHATPAAATAISTAADAWTANASAIASGAIRTNSINSPTLCRSIAVQPTPALEAKTLVGDSGSGNGACTETNIPTADTMPCTAPPTRMAGTT